MFKIKRYCKFCGEKLDLSPENHYVAEKLEKDRFFTNTKKYDAVDCVCCGRQYIMGERFTESYDIKKLEKRYCNDEE